MSSVPQTMHMVKAKKINKQNHHEMGNNPSYLVPAGKQSSI